MFTYFIYFIFNLHALLDNHILKAAAGTLHGVKTFVFV